MNKKLSVILAVIVLVINSFLGGLYAGFDKGYYEGHSNSPLKDITGGITIYTTLFEHYQLILLLSIIFLAGMFIKKRYVTQIACSFILLLTMWSYYKIYLIKTNLFTPELSFNELIIKTMSLDWLCFFIILTLLTIQIITVFQQFFIWKNKNEGIE